MLNRICYRRLHKYKYQLMEPYRYQTELADLGHRATKDDWVVLRNDGWLELRKGYAWDGPSGPSFDTPDFMRGSLIHDALYQLIRERLLKMDQREYADQLLRKICRRDGMSRIRASWVYWAVRGFGKKAAQPQPSQPYLYAP